MDTTWTPAPLTPPAAAVVAAALPEPTPAPVVDVWSGHPDTDRAWRIR